MPRNRMRGTGEEAGRCLTAERGRVLAPGWQPEPGQSSWIQSGLEDLVSANKWGVLCQSEDPVLDLAPKLFETHKAASGGLCKDLWDFKEPRVGVSQVCAVGI